MAPLASLIPPVLDDDDDDVAWALQTALVQWKRGALSDALSWLQRAIENAESIGASRRAESLRASLPALAAHVWAQSADALEIAPDEEVEEAKAEVEKASEVTEETRSAQANAAMSAAHQAKPEPQALAQATQAAETEPNQDEDAPVEAAALAEQGVDLGDELSAKSAAQVLVGSQGEGEESEAPSKPALNSVPLPSPSLRLRPEAAEPDVDSVPLPSPSLSLRPEPGEPAPDSVPLPSPSLAVQEDGFGGSSLGRPSAHPGARGFSTSSISSFPPSEESLRPPPLGVSAPLEPETGDQIEEGEVVLHGVPLVEVRGLQDLPDEAQRRLATGARIVNLGPDEEVGDFGAALVLAGTVYIMPTLADAACASASVADIVFSRGSLEQGIDIRVVGAAENTKVAVFSRVALDAEMAQCPWVEEDLRQVADHYQALAGAGMGMMGERLDDSLRGMITSRCEVQHFGAGELVVGIGQPVEALYVVGAGSLDLTDATGENQGEAHPGDFLFAQEIMRAGPARLTARAGAGGVLLLRAERRTAHELMLSVPPLLEILAAG